MLQSKIRYGMSKMLQMALQHIRLTSRIVWLVPTLVLQASVSSLRAEWQSELAGLKSELDHKRRQAAAALKAKQEEEDLKVRGRGGGSKNRMLSFFQATGLQQAVSQARVCSSYCEIARHLDLGTCTCTTAAAAAAAAGIVLVSL
jgi:hypothetical protein